MAGNREWLGTTYFSHCSTRSNEDAFLIFCSRQYTNRANSPKARWPWSAAVEEWTKILATETETETCIIDRVTLIAPTHALLWCIKSTRKKTRNHGGAVLVCSQGTTSKVPQNHYVPPAKHTIQQYMGLLTDFKKKMHKTKLHSCHLVHVEVPVNSLLLKQNTAQWMRVRETAPTRPKEEDPTTRLSPSSLRPVSFK